MLWKKVFQDRFYLEVQRYGDDSWRKRENQYIEKVIFLAAENKVPLVATQPYSGLIELDCSKKIAKIS